MHIKHSSNESIHSNIVIQKTLFNEALLKTQISADLKNKIDSFYNGSAAFSTIERKTGISKRQIFRYLNRESIPQFLNLKAIYAYLLDEPIYEKLIKLVPPVVEWELERKNPCKGGDEISHNLDYSDRMLQDPAFTAIYWKTVDGDVITKKEVKTMYGIHGLNVLEDMLKKKIIIESIKGVYTTGPERSAPVNAKACKHVAKELIETYFKPENADKEISNYLGFNVLKMDDEAKETVLKKMMDLNFEIIKLAENSKGLKKPFFTTVCIDTMFTMYHDQTDNSPHRMQ